MPGHWVVIETASNQAFIFACNKQAANVGASELIVQVGTEWVPEAARLVRQDGAEVDEIVAASGKALLVVDTVEHGQSIIRRVTDTALRKAPGLQVWGVVDPDPIADDADRGPVLQRARRLHAACRASRPSSLLRAPTLPFVKPCQYSGLPATVVGREGSDWYPRGAAVHADGNGVGQLFTRLPRCTPDRTTPPGCVSSAPRWTRSRGRHWPTPWPPSRIVPTGSCRS